MRRIKALAAATALFALASPAISQGFSDSFTFLKAVRERDGAKVQPLVETPNPAILNAKDAATGEGALHILVRGRDLNWLNFLVAKGARVDLQSQDGTTPLMLAAQLGWYEGAEFLLGRRANPNLGNASGETPLILAVQRRDLPMVRLLKGRGANPNQTDSVAGLSALDYARQDSRSAAILRILE